MPVGLRRSHPLYDLLCGEVWPRITRRLPQAINGRTEAAHLHGFDWQALARRVGLSPAQTLRRVNELCALTADKVSEARDRIAAMPAGDHAITQLIVRTVQKRCARIASQALVLRDTNLGTADPRRSS